MRQVWGVLAWTGAAVAAAACGNLLGGTGLPGFEGPRDAGPAWRVFTPDPTVANWRGVWAPRHDVAYVVGDDGAIMKWTAPDRWRRLESGTSEDLESVWGRSETDIFVVGHNGVVLHGDGESFAPIQFPDGDGGMRNPTDRNLFTVFGHRDQVFMAGERGEVLGQDPDGGVYRMVDETTLRTFPVCESRVLNVQEPVATCTTQLVPRQDDAGMIVYGPDRYPSCGTPPECCVFEGQPNGPYCCYPQRCDADGGPLVGRVGVDADLKAGWAGADFAVLCGAGGAIYEWRDGDQGRKWYKNELAENTPYTRDNLAAAWGFGAGASYCAGQDGRLMRRQNGDWNARLIPTPVYVQGLWGTSTRDLYAVGFSGMLLRLDAFEVVRDAGWYPEDVEVDGHLRAVFGVRLDYDGGVAPPDGGPPEARVWVVGSQGKVLIKN